MVADGGTTGKPLESLYRLTLPCNSLYSVGRGQTVKCSKNELVVFCLTERISLSQIPVIPNLRNPFVRFKFNRS